MVRILKLNIDRFLSSTIWFSKSDIFFCCKKNNNREIGNNVVHAMQKELPVSNIYWTVFNDAIQFLERTSDIVYLHSFLWWINRLKGACSMLLAWLFVCDNVCAILFFIRLIFVSPWILWFVLMAIERLCFLRNLSYQTSNVN